MNLTTWQMIQELFIDLALAGGASPESAGLMALSKMRDLEKLLARRQIGFEHGEPGFIVRAPKTMWDDLLDEEDDPAEYDDYHGALPWNQPGWEGGSK